MQSMMGHTDELLYTRGYDIFLLSQGNIQLPLEVCFHAGEDFLCVTSWTRGRDFKFHNNGSYEHLPEAAGVGYKSSTVTQSVGLSLSSGRLFIFWEGEKFDDFP